MRTYQVMRFVAGRSELYETVGRLESAVMIVAALTERKERAWVLPLAPTVPEFARTKPIRKGVSDTSPSTRYSFVNESLMGAK